jgi:antibiotic biosynthesis monooxygenase (ABM) superfamily enzyme
MRADRPGSATGLPVTVVISRAPAPGRQDDLVVWAHGIVDAASAFPGHLGAQVYPPAPPDRDDVVIAFSFASAEALSAWERSAERRAWTDRSHGLVAGDARTHAVSGFEGIFSRTLVPPPRWKTAAVIWLALYPMSLLVSWLAAPHLVTWNLFLRVMLTTSIVVPYMSWIGVPWLSRRLRTWLQSSR